MDAKILPEFSDRVTGYRLVVIEANVTNSPTGDALKSELDGLAKTIATDYTLPDINRRPAIAATRAAYKACGKEPNRYRPSQEQLMRRIVRGLGLYYVDSLVDAGNMLSLATGCSVGCFDRDKVQGDCISIGVGRAGEPYEGIGRGPLNIEGMPVVRDAAGGIGTPTSDNERTKISAATSRLLTTVHLFDAGIEAEEVVRLFTDIFGRHAAARDIEWRLYSC